jgi:hypothetical protein
MLAALMMERDNDLGLSGGAGGTLGRAPCSIPAYPRPRPLASGHVRSDLGLDTAELTPQPPKEAGAFRVLGSCLEVGDSLLDVMLTPDFRAVFLILTSECRATQVGPQLLPCADIAAPWHWDLVPEVDTAIPTLRTEHRTLLLRVPFDTLATLEAHPSATTHVAGV